MHTNTNPDSANILLHVNSFCSKEFPIFRWEVVSVVAGDRHDYHATHPVESEIDRKKIKPSFRVISRLRNPFKEKASDQLTTSTMVYVYEQPQYLLPIYSSLFTSHVNLRNKCTIHTYWMRLWEMAEPRDIGPWFKLCTHFIVTQTSDVFNLKIK